MYGFKLCRLQLNPISLLRPEPKGAPTIRYGVRLKCSPHEHDYWMLFKRPPIVDGCWGAPSSQRPRPTKCFTSLSGWVLRERRTDQLWQVFEGGMGRVWARLAHFYSLSILCPAKDSRDLNSLLCSVYKFWHCGLRVFTFLIGDYLDPGLIHLFCKVIVILTQSTISHKDVIIKVSSTPHNIMLIMYKKLRWVIYIIKNIIVCQPQLW